MKLFYKLFICILIGITGIIGVEGIINYKTGVAQYNKDMHDNALQIGNSISGMIEHAWAASGKAKVIELIEDANRSNHAIHLRWVWLTAFPQPPHTPTAKLPETPGPGQTISIRQPDKATAGFIYTYIPITLTEGPASAIEVRQSLKPLKDFTRKVLIQSVSVGIILLVMTGVILFIFIHYQIRKRLHTLDAKAKRINAGDIEPNLAIHGNDELSDLALTLNDMCRRLLTAQRQVDTIHEARNKTLEQLRHTEKLSTLGHITAGIAHEMGTPLNVVSGRAKMIEAGTITTEAMINSAAVIRSQADRMTGIIRQLLDFTRRDKPKYTPTNMASLIKQVFDILRPMAKKQQVTLNLNSSDTAPVLLPMDPNQIQQVLINLIMNSIQAMPSGGDICVDLFKKEIHDIKDFHPGSYLGIKITDTGDGITPDDEAHIFEPFFSTKKVGEGTGLGLPIVKDIVEEHHGWIDVESKKSKATAFIVYLPSENR